MTDIVEGTGAPKLILGQDLYIPLFKERIIVKAQINELFDIYSLNGKSVWHNYDIWGTNRITTASEEKDENGWPIPKEVQLEDIKDLKLYNQFPWCNFPTHGHAAYIGEDSFLTLEEARSVISKSNKKHLIRRLKNELKVQCRYFDGKKWISWSKEQREYYKDCLTLKVYVRKY